VLLDYLRRRQHDVLIPTDDATLRLISRHEDEFERLTHVPIPSPEQLAYGLDKSKAMALAEAAGVPHPRTVYPRDADAAAALRSEIDGRSDQAPLALGGRGIVYVEPHEDVAAAWRRYTADGAGPMLQQCIPQGPSTTSAC